MSKDQIAKVLWDIKTEDRENLPINFLIKRVLVYGGSSLLREMFKEFGKNKITEIFKTLKISEVGVRRHHFLTQYIIS